VAPAPAGGGDLYRRVEGVTRSKEERKQDQERKTNGLGLMPYRRSVGAIGVRDSGWIDLLPASSSAGGGRAGWRARAMSSFVIFLSGLKEICCWSSPDLPRPA
jgi:hypothetical protein